MPAATKLYQRIAGDVAARIAAGRYPIGTRLPGERDLATEFGVSRPTIREAMIALEMRGMVEARQKSGVFVVATGTAPPDDLDVGAFELIEARVLVEGEAAALAALAIDEEGIASLRELLAAMETAPDQPGMVDLDRRFHLAVAQGTGNGLVAAMIENLWDVRSRSPLCIRMFAEARRSGVAPRVAEHRPIVDALAARDSHAARDAMRSHLRRVADDLLEATRVEMIQRAEAEHDARRQHLGARTTV